jgi:phosphoribosylaminoimidazole-succinocarboxamide synthase
MLKERRGSTRVIRAYRTGEISLLYTQKLSAFDRGAGSQDYPGIDAARCVCSVKSFELAQKAGLPTHFVEQISDRTILVREFAVPNKAPLSGKVHGRVLDLELVHRSESQGSFQERADKGIVTPEMVGLPVGTKITKGMKFPKMFLETTTKFGTTDEPLSDSEAKLREGLDEESWGKLWGLVSGAIHLSNEAYAKAGFNVPDGKLEAGRLADGSFCIVDVFGTQDENRLIDLKTDELYSKDLLRNWLKEQKEWYALLTQAKKEHRTDKSKWPPYPPIPEGLVALISSRYAEAAKRYTGITVNY